MHFTVFLLVASVTSELVTGKRNEVLKITSILNSPYLSKLQDFPNNQTSDVTAYVEGYVIDLLQELANEANFKYEISLETAYGAKDGNNNWSGMIGQVLKGNADLAVADLTVTKSREEDVDFSYPFMTTGIGLLVKRPPYYSINDKNDSRTLLLYPVSSINDLPYQNEVQYGAVSGGSTYAFFKNSNDVVYKLIGEKMVADPSMLSQTIREASERVKNSNGRYTFFMEGAAIEYLTGKSCDFMKLGGYIHSRSYAIAMRKNFPLKTRINIGLLAMQEKGILDRLKKKWFGQVMDCDDSLGSSYAKNALNLVLRSIK